MLSELITRNLNNIFNNFEEIILIITFNDERPCQYQSTGRECDILKWGIRVERRLYSRVYRNA